MKTKQNKNQSIIIRFAWKCRSLTCFLARPLLKLVKIPKAEVNQSHSWYKVGLPHCPFINTPLLPTLSWCFQPSIHWNVQVCRFTGTFKSVFWISTPLAEQIQWQSLSLSLKKKKMHVTFPFQLWKRNRLSPETKQLHTDSARDERERQDVFTHSGCARVKWLSSAPGHTSSIKCWRVFTGTRGNWERGSGYKQCVVCRGFHLGRCNWTRLSTDARQIGTRMFEVTSWNSSFFFSLFFFF